MRVTPENKNSDNSLRSGLINATTVGKKRVQHMMLCCLNTSTSIFTLNVDNEKGATRSLNFTLLCPPPPGKDRFSYSYFREVVLLHEIFMGHFIVYRTEFHNQPRCIDFKSCHWLHFVRWSYVWIYTYYLRLGFKLQRWMGALKLISSIVRSF